MGVSEPEIGTFLSGLDPRQAALIQELRDLVARGVPTLDEVVNTGPWLTGYLFYGTRESEMVFAIGATRGASVTFHAMPWYSSPELREAYGDDLAPFASGKSCFRFGADAVLPRHALGAVIAAAPRFLEVRARHPSAPRAADQCGPERDGLRASSVGPGAPGDRPQQVAARPVQHPAPHVGHDVATREDGR